MKQTKKIAPFDQHCNKSRSRCCCAPQLELAQKPVLATAAMRACGTCGVWRVVPCGVWLSSDFLQKDLPTASAARGGHKKVYGRGGGWLVGWGAKKEGVGVLLRAVGGRRLGWARTGLGDPLALELRSCRRATASSWRRWKT
jgi:hypothetical protein